MLRKTIKVLDKTVDRIVLIASSLFFLICFYAMYDAVMVYYNANDTSILKYKPTVENAEVLKELSDDAIAWLTVDDTNIDYPVMQGKDNSVYLNKNPYGNYSLSGSIFLDSRCNKKFNGNYFLLYGHHMNYGSMFGALDRFIEKDYFDSHRTGTLITLDGVEYTIDFFASVKTQATDKVVFDPVNTSVQKIIQFLEKDAAVYQKPKLDKSSKIIALSTCQSAETIERMVVFGTMTTTG